MGPYGRARLGGSRAGRVSFLLLLLMLVCSASALAGCRTVANDLEDSVTLVIPTYEGSGQIAHPTVIDFSVEYGLEQWGGHRYWMSGSPYPGANDRYENPCVWVSDDGVSWQVPQGIPQPLVETPADYARHARYNSDPTIVYNPHDDLIELYYRESLGRDDEATILIHRLDIRARTTNTTGEVSFDLEQRSLRTPSFTRDDSILSPSVVIDDDGMHYMLAVSNAVNGTYGVIVMRGELDGLAYGDPIVCEPSAEQAIIGPEGLPPVRPWHLSAKRDRVTDQIVMLINGQAYDGKRRIRNLYWAQTSLDYLSEMTYPQPDALMEGSNTWQPYRSTFVLAADEYATPLRLWVNWYSTHRPQVWSIDYLER